MTYDFRIAAADKPTLYRDLASALAGRVQGDLHVGPFVPGDPGPRPLSLPARVEVIIRA